MKKQLVNLKLLAFIGLLSLIFIIGGCATFRPLALTPDKQKLDISKESIALVVVKVANEYKNNYQPNIKYIFVWEDKNKKNVEKYSFEVNDKYHSVKNEFNEYLISFQLPPGKYKLRECFAQSGFLPFSGSFSLPIYKVFSIEPNKIVYLGNIDARIIKRTSDDEWRAGPRIPLLDQAVIGASGGTFIVKITDRYKEDIFKFKQKFPFLAEYDIINLALSPWKKPTEEDLQ